LKGDAQAGGTEVRDGDASEAVECDVQRRSQCEAETKRSLKADHVSFGRTVKDKESLSTRVSGKNTSIGVTGDGATKKIAAPRARKKEANGAGRFGGEAQLCKVGRGVKAEFHLRM
jgi:hypothetical protein